MAFSMISGEWFYDPIITDQATEIRHALVSSLYPSSPR